MLKKTKETIKKRESRDTGNIGHKTQNDTTKQKTTTENHKDVTKCRMGTTKNRWTNVLAKGKQFLFHILVQSSPVKVLSVIEERRKGDVKGNRSIVIWMLLFY